MTDLDITKNLYLESWRNILTLIAGWNQQETEAWVSQAAEIFNLDDPASWVYHEPAVYWLTGAIINKIFKTPLSDQDHLAATGAILTALDFGGPDFSHIQDWNFYGKQLNQKLQQFRRQRTPKSESMSLLAGAPR